MKKTRFVVPVLVVLLLLMTAIIPASAGQPGSGTTTIYVQNADSANDAQIVASFYDYDGSSAAGDVMIASLPPYVGYTISLTDPSPALPTTWRGAVVVSSNQQVAAVGRTIYTNTPLGDHLTASEYTAMANPATTSYAAYVWNHVSRNTIFSIQNTENSAATIYIHYIDSESGEIPGSGSCSGSPIVDTIPANGVNYYDLLNQTRNGTYDGGAGGTIPCQNDGGATQPAAGSPGFFNGGLFITSTNEIAVASDTYWQRYEGAYTGAVADDTILYFPQVVRHKNPSGTWIRWSGPVIMNTQNFPVDVTVEFNGLAGSLSFNDTIPANGAHEYNTRYQGHLPASVWSGCTSAHGLQPGCAMESALTSLWTGGVKVTVNTPGGRIVGVGHVMYQAYHAFSYEAGGPSAGTYTAVCPVVRDYSSDINSRYTGLVVQNVSGSSATVSLYFFLDGSTTGGLANADLVLNGGGSGYVIAPGGNMEGNTKYNTPQILESEFDAIGGGGYANNWRGSAVVVSDQPIMAAVSNFQMDGTNAPPMYKWSTTYDCYNVP